MNTAHIALPRPKFQPQPSTKLPLTIPIIGRREHFEIISRVWGLRDVRSLNTFQFQELPQSYVQIRWVCNEVSQVSEFNDALTKLTLHQNIGNLLTSHDQIWWDQREMDQYTQKHPEQTITPASCPLEHHFFYNSNFAITFPKTFIEQPKEHWYFQDLATAQQQKKFLASSKAKSNTNSIFHQCSPSDDPQDTITIHPMFDFPNKQVMSHFSCASCFPTTTCYLQYLNPCLDGVPSLNYSYPLDRVHYEFNHQLLHWFSTHNDTPFFILPIDLCDELSINIAIWAYHMFIACYNNNSTQPKLSTQFVIVVFNSIVLDAQLLSLGQLQSWFGEFPYQVHWQLYSTAIPLGEDVEILYNEGPSRVISSLNVDNSQSTASLASDRHVFGENATEQPVRSPEEQSNIDLATFLDSTLINSIISQYFDILINDTLQVDVRNTTIDVFGRNIPDNLQFNCPTQDSLRYPYEALIGSEIPIMSKAKTHIDSLNWIDGIGGVITPEQIDAKYQDHELHQNRKGQKFVQRLRRFRVNDGQQPKTDIRRKLLRKLVVPSVPVASNPEIPSIMSHWCCLDLCDNINMNLSMNSNGSNQEQQINSTPSSQQPLHKVNKFDNREALHSCSTLTFSWNHLPSLNPYSIFKPELLQQTEAPVGMFDYHSRYNSSNTNEHFDPWDDFRIKKLLNGLVFNILSMPFEVGQQLRPNTQFNEENHGDNVSGEINSSLSEPSSVKVAKQRFNFDTPRGSVAYNYPKQLKSKDSLCIEHHMTGIVDKVSTFSTSVVVDQVGSLEFKSTLTSADQASSASTPPDFSPTRNAEGTSSSTPSTPTAAVAETTSTPTNSFPTYSASVDIYQSYYGENRVYSMMHLDDRVLSLIDFEKNLAAKRRLGILPTLNSTDTQNDDHQINPALLSTETNLPDSSQLLPQLVSHSEQHLTQLVNSQSTSVTQLSPLPHHFQIYFNPATYWTNSTQNSTWSQSLFSFSIINLSTLRREIAVIEHFRELIFQSSWKSIFSWMNRDKNKNPQKFQYSTSFYSKNPHTQDGYLSQGVNTYKFLRQNNFNFGEANASRFSRQNRFSFRSDKENLSNQHVVHVCTVDAPVRSKIESFDYSALGDEFCYENSPFAYNTTATTKLSKGIPAEDDTIPQQPIPRPRTKEHVAQYQSAISLPFLALHEIDFTQLLAEPRNLQRELVPHFLLVVDDLYEFFPKSDLDTASLTFTKLPKSKYKPRGFVSIESKAEPFVLKPDESTPLSPQTQLINSYLKQVVPKGLGIPPQGNNDIVLHYSFSANHEEKILETLVECMKVAIGIRMDHYSSMTPVFPRQL